MYHQFKELAEVDITKEPMEIGPTCHYVMGGVEVDPDSAMSKVPGLFAAGEVAGGMHGANRLGGNSLGDLLVFGKRAGEHAADYARSTGALRPKMTDVEIEEASTEALAPFTTEGGENPYTVHHELQDVMQDLVGIIRTESELVESHREGQRAEGPDRQADRRGATVGTTRAGTSPSTCATCCSSRRRWPWPPSSARRAVAATPATTTR